MITACCILHNLLLDVKDDWKKHEGWWTPEEKDDHDEKLLFLSQKQETKGLEKREQAKEFILGKRVIDI